MVNGEKGNEVEMPLFFDYKRKAFYILDTWDVGLQF